MGKQLTRSKRKFQGNRFVKRDVSDVLAVTVPGRKRGRPLKAVFSSVSRPTILQDVRPLPRTEEQGNEENLPIAQSTPKPVRGTRGT